MHRSSEVPTPTEATPPVKSAEAAEVQGLSVFFFVRRSIINRFPDGKLSEDFFMYCEDVQWCYRIREMGRAQISIPN